MCYDLFRSELFIPYSNWQHKLCTRPAYWVPFLFLTALLTNYLVHKTEESAEIASQREIDLANMEQLTQFIM